MNFEITKRFEKEFKLLSKGNNLASSLNAVIDIVSSARKISDIKNIKKLSGYKIYYRIRVGKYRAGIKIENDTVIFAVFDYRKDIYKKSP